MRYLYFHERDDKGQLKFPKRRRGKPAPTLKEVFYRKWQQHGLRADLIDKLWKEQYGG